MPDFLKDSSAPYVVALLASVVGWLITQVYNDLNASHIIEYSIEYERKIAGKHFSRVKLLNHSSLAKPITGTILLKCKSSDETPHSDIVCLDINRQPESGSLTPLNLDNERPIIQSQIAKAQFVSPSGTAIIYKIPLLDQSYDIRMQIVLSNEQLDRRIIFATSLDPRVIIIKNFLWITLFVFSALFFTIFVFLLYSIFRLFFTKNSAHESGGSEIEKKFKVTVEDE